MISVGCDMGLRKSGIVLLRDNFEIESQNLIRTSETVKGAERLCDIERGFDSIVRPYFPLNKRGELTVFIEGYAYGAKYQRESLAELGGVMRRYFYLNKLTFWVISPTNVKSFVTGSGKASKNYMKKCTKEKWGQNFKSDDVCDAYGIARIGMNVMKVLNGTASYAHLDSNEQSVIKDMLTNQDMYKNANTAKRKSKRNAKTKRTTKS